MPAAVFSDDARMLALSSRPPARRYADIFRQPAIAAVHAAFMPFAFAMMPMRHATR